MAVFLVLLVIGAVLFGFGFADSALFFAAIGVVLLAVLGLLVAPGRRLF